MRSQVIPTRYCRASQLGLFASHCPPSITHSHTATRNNSVLAIMSHESHKGSMGAIKYKSIARFKHSQHLDFDPSRQVDH